jgi:hypothetical protein
MASLLAVNGQKTVNDLNAEKRDISGFHGIEVSTGIQLMVTEGTTEEVAVSAVKEEYRDRIVTKVENGILKIYYDNKLKAVNSNKEKKELKAYVSYKSLDRLDANTGAQVDIQETLKAASLKMMANTGAVIKGRVDVKELDIHQNTGSVVTLSGNADKLVIEGDTGSMFKGSDLKTGNCTATTSTGAGIYVTVDKELNVRANTGGFVKYKGDAGIKEIKTHTGGSVSKI